MTGGVNFKDLAIVLKEATADAPAVAIKYGAFINSVLDFIIIALAIFVIVKWMNELKKAEEKKQKIIEKKELNLLTDIKKALDTGMLVPKKRKK